MRIGVVNLKRGQTGEYIGRGGYGKDRSPLANCYLIGKDGSREQVIAKYRRWLWAQMNNGNPEVVGELRRLLALARREEGVKLACYCTPLLCHGLIIKSCLEWLDQVEGGPLVAEAIELGGVIARCG